MTMFTREREAGPARLGIAATRKMGAAVERNRAKRLVRELFRHDKPAVASTSSSCRAAECWMHL